MRFFPLALLLAIAPVTFAEEAPLPSESSFAPELTVIQSKDPEGGSFFILTLHNTSESLLSFPKAWFNNQLDVIKITQKGKEYPSLATYPPVPIDLSPLFQLPPGSKIETILSFFANTTFDVERARGDFTAQWIHHPNARCKFSVLKDGTVKLRR